MNNHHRGTEAVFLKTGVLNLASRVMALEFIEKLPQGFDTITGELSGRPVMTQGGTSYEMDEVYYNFQTRKARIRNMATKQDEGKLMDGTVLAFNIL